MKKDLFQRRFYFVVLLSLSSLLSASAGDDAEGIIAKLQKKYEGINDARVQFSRQVEFGVTKAVQTFQGTLEMKKGNKYRIELEDQTIVTDGHSVWSYSKANNQVLIDKYRDDPNSFSPDKIVVNIPTNYTAMVLDKEKIGDRETTVLKLLPKKEHSTVRWMKIWVDTDESLMKRIQVLDASENLATYTVKEIKLNSRIPDSRFQFDPPEGAEVVDLR